MNIFTITSNIIKDKIAIIRDKDSNSSLFSYNLKQITTLMLNEISNHLSTKQSLIKTPLSSINQQIISDQIVVISILRSSLVMELSFIKTFPNSKILHLGVFRDEKTYEPNYYYWKSSLELSKYTTIIIDPMLATGGSATFAINKAIENKAEKIFFVSIIASQKGITSVAKKFPNVKFFTAVIDPKLNKNKYIEPGLGDAGDRMFNTKA